jgi:hypothetical protein
MVLGSTTTRSGAGLLKAEVSFQTPEIISMGHPLPMASSRKLHVGELYRRRYAGISAYHISICAIYPFAAVRISPLAFSTPTAPHQGIPFPRCVLPPALVCLLLFWFWPSCKCSAHDADATMPPLKPSRTLDCARNCNRCFSALLLRCAAPEAAFCSPRSLGHDSCQTLLRGRL